jgi:hypothetical protein
MELLVRGLARLLGVNPNNFHSHVHDVQIETVSTEDLTSDIYQGDESSLSIDLTKIKTPDDIFGIDDLEAPRCYRCSNVNPGFIWHKRYYCGKCLREKDVLLGELHPAVVPKLWRVGLVVLKNSFRLPILWNYDDTDTIYMFQRAKKKDKLWEVYDLAESRVYIDPRTVQVIKEPIDLYSEEWTKPVGVKRRKTKHPEIMELMAIREQQDQGLKGVPKRVPYELLKAYQMSTDKFIKGNIK